MSAAPRRWMARVLLGLLLVVGSITVATVPAAADECKPDGIPQRAGSGMAGSIDDKVDRSTGTKYGDYGWSNLRWYTCDLGNGGVINDQLPDPAKDPNAVMDTAVGNGGLGFAAGLAAMMTQLHEWVANPGAFLDPVDNRIGPITQVITDAVWTPYGGAVVALAALFVGVWGYNNGNVRRIGRTLAAILIALLAIAWFSAQMTVPVPTDTLDRSTGRPVTQTKTVSGAEYAAGLFDGIAVDIVGTVDNAILASGSDGAQKRLSAEESRGALLQDRLLYMFWAQGATGCRAADLPDKSPGCRAAEKLYTAQSVKWDDPNPDSEERRDAYKAAADKLREADPAAYQTLRGKDNTRAGTGLFAALFMVLLAIIRIPAELMILIGLMVVRLVVIMGPLFALAAIIESTRPIATMALKMVFASIYNVAVFGVIAAVHSAIVLTLMGTNMVVSFVLVAVLTVVTWIVTKPFRSIARPATGNAVAQQMQDAEGAPGRAWGGVKSLVGSAAGSYLGSRAGTDDDDEEKGNTNITNTSNSVTMLNLSGGPSTPDRFRRKEPSWPEGERQQVGLRTVPNAASREGERGADEPSLVSTSTSHLALPPGPNPPAAGVPSPLPGGPNRPGGPVVLPVGRERDRAALSAGPPPEPLDTASIERQVEVQAASQPEEVGRPPVQRETVAAPDPDIFVPRSPRAPSGREVVITGEVVDVVDEIQVRRSTKLVEPEVTADGSLTTELFRPRELSSESSERSSESSELGNESREPVGV